MHGKYHTEQYKGYMIHIEHPIGKTGFKWNITHPKTPRSIRGGTQYTFNEKEVIVYAKKMIMEQINQERTTLQLQIEIIEYERELH